MAEYEYVRNDKLYSIEFTLQNFDGSAADLTDVTLITINAAAVGAAALKFTGTCVRSLPYTAGICTYTVQQTDTDTIGIYHAEIVLTYSGGKIFTTDRFDMKIVKDLP